MKLNLIHFITMIENPKCDVLLDSQNFSVIAVNFSVIAVNYLSPLQRPVVGRLRRKKKRARGLFSRLYLFL